MSMLSEKVVNAHKASVFTRQTPTLGNADHTTSIPDAHNWHVVPLDQLKVVEGVYRKEQLTSSDQLVPGDEIQFPLLDDQSRASRLSQTGQASIEVFTANRFGPTSFGAAVTHCVVFLSETGHQLTGYVLRSSPNANNRPSVLICGDPRSAADYELIKITETHETVDFADANTADATVLSATLPDTTWGAAG